MALVIPAGFAQAAFIFSGTVGTPEYVTTIGLDISNYGSDYVGAANNAFEAYAGLWMPDCYTGISLEKVSLSLSLGGDNGSIDSTSTPVAGGGNGQFQPIAMAAICNKSTNRLGRSGRGRMFLPGLLRDEDVSPGGNIGASKLADLNGLANDFLALLSSGAVGTASLTSPLPPYLLHNDQSAGSSTPTVLTGLQIAPKVGWIRGRLR